MDVEGLPGSYENRPTDPLETQIPSIQVSEHGAGTSSTFGPAGHPTVPTTTTMLTHPFVQQLPAAFVASQGRGHSDHGCPPPSTTHDTQDVEMSTGIGHSFGNPPQYPSNASWPPTHMPSDSLTSRGKGPMQTPSPSLPGSTFHDGQASSSATQNVGNVQSLHPLSVERGATNNGGLAQAPPPPSSVCRFRTPQRTEDTTLAHAVGLT